MSDAPWRAADGLVGWQGLVRANVPNLMSIRTLDRQSKVGPLILTPTMVVRREPNVDQLVSPGWRHDYVSSPISVDGAVAAGEAGANHVGAVARMHLWRACVLLDLVLSQAYWPLFEPSLHFMVGVRDTRRVDPADPSLARFDPCTQLDDGTLDDSNLVELPGWTARAWARLDGDGPLEQIAQRNLHSLHHLARGHQEADLALLGLISVFDAVGARLGKSTPGERVRRAIRKSFELVPGPAGDVDTDSERLAALYTERNRIGHEGVRLLLVGAGSGPLGDKRGDLDGLDRWVDTSDLVLLARQSRVLIAYLLGAAETV